METVRALETAPFGKGPEGEYLTPYGVSFRPWHGCLWTFAYDADLLHLSYEHADASSYQWRVSLGGKILDEEVRVVLAVLALDPQALRTMPRAVAVLRDKTGARDAWLMGGMLGAWEVRDFRTSSSQSATAFNNPFGLRYFPLAEHTERKVGCTTADTFDVTVRSGGWRTLAGVSLDRAVAAFRSLV